MAANEKVPREIAAAEAEERRADALIAKARAGEDAAEDELSRRTEELSASYAAALKRAQELLDAGRDPGAAAAEVARARRNQLHAFLTSFEAKVQVWQAEIDRLEAWVHRAEAEVKDRVTRRRRVEELRHAHERVQATLHELRGGSHKK